MSRSVVSLQTASQPHTTWQTSQLSTQQDADILNEFESREVMDEKCRDDIKEAVQKKLHSKGASQSQQPWDGLMSLLQCMLRSASKRQEMREHSSETSEVIATIQEKNQDKEADRKHCKACNKVEDDGEETKRRMEGE